MNRTGNANTKNTGKFVGAENLTPQAKSRAERIQQKAKQCGDYKPAPESQCILDARYKCNPLMCPPILQKGNPAGMTKSLLEMPQKNTPSLPTPTTALTINRRGYSHYLKMARKTKTPFKETFSEACMQLQIGGVVFVCFLSKGAVTNRC